MLGQKGGDFTHCARSANKGSMLPGKILLLCPVFDRLFDRNTLRPPLCTKFAALAFSSSSREMKHRTNSKVRA